MEGETGRNGYGFVLRIAIPCFSEEVAPRFEAARRFRYWLVEDNKVIQYQEISLDRPPDGFERIRLMEQYDVNVVLCNGISETSRQILKAKGCKVIQSVMGSASDALFGYLAEKIVQIGQSHPLLPGPDQPSTVDLVEWTFDLVSSLGWSVKKEKRPEAYPVDMTARLTCPVCNHEIRVAICCGAHAFRVDQEIREFHRVTATGYHDRIYIHQQLPGVARTCTEYGIHLIDPSDFSSLAAAEGETDPLILLTGPVDGHDRLKLLKEPTHLERGKP